MRHSLVAHVLRVFSSAEAENRPKSAHRYNVAEQQLIYKSEIERIWKAQIDSLSRKDEPELSDEEDKKDTKKVPQPLSTPGTSHRTSPPPSRGSSLEREREGSVGLDGSKSVLRIKRLVSDFCRCPLVVPVISLTTFGLFLSLILLLDRRELANGNHQGPCRHTSICSRTSGTGRRSNACRLPSSYWGCR